MTLQIQWLLQLKQHDLSDPFARELEAFYVAKEDGNAHKPVMESVFRILQVFSVYFHMKVERDRRMLH